MINHSAEELCQVVVGGLQELKGEERSERRSRKVGYGQLLRRSHEKRDLQSRRTDTTSLPLDGWRT